MGLINFLKDTRNINIIEYKSCAITSTIQGSIGDLIETYQEQIDKLTQEDNIQNSNKIQKYKKKLELELKKKETYQKEIIKKYNMITSEKRCWNLAEEHEELISLYEQKYQHTHKRYTTK